MTGEARQIVKEGIVSSVYPERHAARIAFEDKDGLISAELPVLTTWAFSNKSYGLPDVGEKVICLFLTNDETSGAGVIIGSRYHDKSTPVVSSQDKARIDFSDGTFVEYDRASHELKIECVGDIHIKGKNVHINE